MTSSAPVMLINGHSVHGRQQLPPSVESAMIYGIGSLREQPSELREAPEVGQRWAGPGWKQPAGREGLRLSSLPRCQWHT